MNPAERNEWRDAARRAVQDAIGAALLTSPNLRRDLPELFRRVWLAYPFGPRKGWPFRCWKKAIKEARHGLEQFLVPGQSDIDRPCPACRAKPGQPCVSVGENDNLAAEFMDASNQVPLLRGNKAPGRITKTLKHAVMHEARKVPFGTTEGVVSAA